MRDFAETSVSRIEYGGSLRNPFFALQITNVKLVNFKLHLLYVWQVSHVSKFVHLTNTLLLYPCLTFL